MAMSVKKKKIIIAYSRLFEKLNTQPTFRQLERKTGTTKDMVKHHFGSMKALYLESKRRLPKYFKNDLSNLFNNKNLNALKSDIAKYKRFIVTTAVVGCEANETFLKCINNYCTNNNAKLLTLTASDPAAKVSKGNYISKSIPRDSIVVANLKLNSNLHLSTIKLSSKHIDPTSGLTRLGQKNGSFIYASPKQRLKTVPVGNSKLSHVVMTTGSITDPNYDTDMYFSERTAYIADHDHVLGALIVEIKDENSFHFRQIQFKEDHFIDLNKTFYSDRIEDNEAEGLVLGDLHSGSTDPLAVQAWQELASLIKPKHIILHDTFDGKSINHHEQDNIVERANSAKNGLLSLKDELYRTSLDIMSWTDYAKEDVVIVASNHDEFLHRYLQKARYAEDPLNHGISIKIADAYVNDGKDPLEFAIMELNYPVASTAACDIKWLKRDQDYKIAGIQCGAHGDQGTNGSRASTRSLEEAYGSGVFGHGHYSEILRNVWRVGTSSYLKLNYNKGASSWVQSSCIINKDGSRQLIHCINGEWKL